MSDDQDRSEDPPPIPPAPWAVPGAPPQFSPAQAEPAPTAAPSEAAAAPVSSEAAAALVPSEAAAAPGPAPTAPAAPAGVAPEDYPAPPTSPPAPPAPNRGLSTGAVLGIVGGALGLLLVIAIVIAVVVVHGTQARTQAPDAVRGYLEAIAAGDAAKAKAYLPPTDRSGPLLTSAVLTRSRQAAPIRGIEVGATSSSSETVVRARYRVGTHPVATTFTVIRTGDRYEVVDGLASLELYSLKGLAITVNGQSAKATSDGFRVFPGTYAVGLASKFLTVSGGGRITLADPKDYGASVDVTPAVSTAGVTEFRSLVTASVTTCLTQTTLDAGCGLALTSPLSDGTTVDEGSVQRSTTPEIQAALTALDPQPVSGTPWLVSAGVFQSPDVTASGTTTDGVHGRYDLEFGPTLGTAYVDFSQSQPTVTWR